MEELPWAKPRRARVPGACTGSASGLLSIASGEKQAREVTEIGRAVLCGM